MRSLFFLAGNRSRPAVRRAHRCSGRRQHQPTPQACRGEPSSGALRPLARERRAVISWRSLIASFATSHWPYASAAVAWGFPYEIVIWTTITSISTQLVASHARRLSTGDEQTQRQVKHLPFTW